VRTTVDLPPRVHQRAQELARERGQSLSKVLAELTERGLESLNQPVQMYIDERTGFPVMRFGRGPITPEDVEAILDDE
jgi:hypothetical protein